MLSLLLAGCTGALVGRWSGVCADEGSLLLEVTSDGADGIAGVYGSAEVDPSKGFHGERRVGGLWMQADDAYGWDRSSFGPTWTGDRQGDRLELVETWSDIDGSQTYTSCPLDRE